MYITAMSSYNNNNSYMYIIYHISLMHYACGTLCALVMELTPDEIIP